MPVGRGKEGAWKHAACRQECKSDGKMVLDRKAEDGEVVMRQGKDHSPIVCQRLTLFPK